MSKDTLIKLVKTYITGCMSYRTFVRSVYDVKKLKDQDTSNLMYDIKTVIVEYSHNNLTYDDFINRLSRLTGGRDKSE